MQQTSPAGVDLQLTLAAEDRMAGILPRILPEPGKFRRLTVVKKRACLQEALGTFLDTLQVDGRDPRDFESLKFQSALEALGEGNLGQAYEDAMALQRHAPVQAGDVGVSGQPLSRDEMATGLRHLLERLESSRPAKRRPPSGTQIPRQ